MIEFASLADLATHLVRENAMIEIGAHEGLELASIILQREAKDEFGRYQDGIGPFPEWAELAESTKEERVRLGFTENDPLLRSGELRDSIEREATKMEAIVGSTSDIMPYHEFGTAKMPPRPVLGITLYRKAEEIGRLIGSYSVSGLIGEDPIHPSLGYDLSGEDEN